MIKVEFNLTDCLNINNFENKIDCSCFLDYLKKYKTEYQFFKNNPIFLYTLDQYIELFLNIEDKKVSLSLKDKSLYPIATTIYLMGNKIVLKYLNDKITEDEFNVEFSQFCFSNVKELFFRIKKYYLKYDFIETIRNYPILKCILTDVELLTMLNNIFSDNQKLKQNKKNIQKIIDYIEIDQVLLLNFQNISSLYEFKNYFIIGRFNYLEVNNGYLFNEKRNSLFLNIKHQIFNDEKLINLCKERSTEYNQHNSLLMFVCQFVFYGLYFKLFNKEDINFLEKNKLLLFLSISMFDQKDFILLLKKNNIKLNHIFDMELSDSKHNTYPKSNLNLIVNVLELPLITNNNVANFLLQYSNYLVNYNSVIFTNKEVINLTKEKLIKPFLENIDVLSKKIRINRKRFFTYFK